MIRLSGLLPVLALLLAGWVTPAAAQNDGEPFDQRAERARQTLQQSIERETARVTDSLRQRLRDIAHPDGNANPQPRPVEPATQPAPGPGPRPVQDGEARPWIGFSARAATDKELEESGIKNGLMVTRVVSNGPASKAGLQATDIIIRFAGRDMHARADLRDALAAARVGDRITVEIYRGRIQARLTIELGTAPEPQPDLTGKPASDGGWIGIQVNATDGGLLVYAVHEGSPAAEGGVLAGDIITRVDGREARRASDLTDAFLHHRIGDVMQLRVRRSDGEQTLNVRIGQKPPIEYDAPPARRPDLQLPELPDGRPDPDVMRRLNQLNEQGVNLLREKKYEDAIQYFEKMLEVVPDDDTALYNLACSYSLMGQLDKAMDYLERSLHAGFEDWDWMQEDSDLNPLRELPRYLALLEKRAEFAFVQAQRKMDSLKAFLGENGIDIAGYHFEVDRDTMLVFATRYSEEVLRHLKRDLHEYAEAQWKHLFIRKPKSYIGIVLTGEEDFRKLVPNRMIGGFYNPQSRTLLMPAMDHALIHEFTHALHFADSLQLRQGHAIWFVEGLATCFENSTLRPDEATGDKVPTPLPNERLPMLQDAVSTGRAIPLRDFVRLSQPQYMANAALCYAQSRYLTMYIWEQGKLKEYYKNYCETYDQDQTGARALEMTLGQSLSQIEAAFFAWVRQLAPFQGHTGEGGAYMGINLEEAEDGIRLTTVVEDGPAGKAGLQVGDVIMEIGGIRIVSSAKLIDILANCKPGDVLHVVYRRNGDQLTTDVTLAARPGAHD